MSLKRLFPLVLGPQEAGSRAFPLDSELEASHTQHHCHLPPLLGDLCFHGHLALLALQSVPVKDFRGIKTDRPPQSQISLLFFVYSLATRSVFSRRALEHGAHGIGLDDALRFSRHRRCHDTHVIATLPLVSDVSWRTLVTLSQQRCSDIPNLSLGFDRRHTVLPLCHFTLAPCGPYFPGLPGSPSRPGSP